MTFKEWFRKNLPAGMSASRFCERLSTLSGDEISRETFRQLLAGKRLGLITKARAVEKLTGGQVSQREVLK